MKKQTLYRWAVYLAGLLLLALGLVLNTKAGLGVSPIISVAYAAAQMTGLPFADTTFAWYTIFVAAELLLHLRLHRPRAGLLLDVLQLPMSLCFTRFMGLFSGLIPEFSGSALPVRLAVLLGAILLTGIGAAMSLDMRIIPNPGDGIVQAVADTIGKGVGFTKNCFDCCCILLTTALSLGLGGRLYGIGVGTVLAMVCVGRVIALFNRLAAARLLPLAGLAAGAAAAG